MISEEIRKCINEEVGAFNQIPLKKGATTGHYSVYFFSILNLMHPKVHLITIPSVHSPMLWQLQYTVVDRRKEIEYERFAEPIITPTTKADEGHDKDILPVHHQTHCPPQ